MAAEVSKSDKSLFVQELLLTTLTTNYLSIDDGKQHPEGGTVNTNESVKLKEVGTETENSAAIIAPEPLRSSSQPLITSGKVVTTVTRSDSCKNNDIVPEEKESATSSSLQASAASSQELPHFSLTQVPVLNSADATIQLNTSEKTIGAGNRREPFLLNLATQPQPFMNGVSRTQRRTEVHPASRNSGSQSRGSTVTKRTPLGQSQSSSQESSS